MDIRDLLVRHEKLVHLNEGSKDNNRPRKLSSNTSSTSHKSSISDGQINTETIGHQHLNAPRPPPPQQPLPQPQSFHHGPPPVPQQGPQDPRTQPRSVACNLDLLSDAALASSVTPVQRNASAVPLPPHSPESRRKSSYGESIVAYTTERPREDQPMGSGYVPQQPPASSYDDYNPFLDEYASSSHFLPPNFDTEQQMLYSRNQGAGVQRRPSKSSFLPGRFPPMQTEARDVGDSASRGIDDSARQSALRISVADHTVIKNRLDEFSAVLPTDFVFPSRHTLTRFLEGYISGLHEHLPFLHLPTFSPAEASPELLLAILAVGAQYRFEKNRGYALWYAAKAVAMEQIRRRRISEVHALLPTAAAYSPHSTRPSPSATYRHSFASAQSERPATQDTHREP